MTIHNRERAQAYSHFREGCDAAPGDTFCQARKILALITRNCDRIESEAAMIEINTDKCDAFYEVEAHIFEMLRNANPDSQIEQAIGLGKMLDDTDSIGRSRIIANIERDRDFLATVNVDATTRERLLGSATQVRAIVAAANEEVLGI